MHWRGDCIDQCLKLARNTAFWSQNCGSASPIMSKRLPKRRVPDQLPLDFGAARRARPACARSENAAAAISPSKKADQSEIPAPSTPPAGQPEIHGAEERQLQEGEQDSICDTSSELAHRSHVGTSSESESGLGFEDIGKLLGSGPLNLSASEKMKLIEEHFVPSESFAFPKVQMNLHNRSFHHGWLKTYRWLVYSKSQDGGYCLPCILFSPGSQTAGNRGVLVRTPFKRWTKVSDVCRGHEQLKYHLDAQVAFEAFKSNMIRPEKSVASQLDGQRAEQLRKNQELIKSIAKTVHFCGKQGIALRGHRDDSTATSSSNRGNFRELLDFRAEAGDEHLQDHFKSRQGNAMYSQGKEMPCTAARRSKIN